MKISRVHHYLLVPVVCSLLVLAVACGPGSPTTPVHTVNASPTATSAPSQASTPTPSGKPGTPTSAGTSTVPMPPTQTSCPQSSTGWPAVMRPLALGSHANIAYIFNEGTRDLVPAFGELKRFDVITGNKTVIMHLPHANISSAQVSADGQWLLFVSDVETAPGKGSSQLQLVRMDGQGLQTLYCATLGTLTGVQWSPDQKFVIFSSDQANPGTPSLYLLILATGTVQREFSNDDINFDYVPMTWLDTARLYLLKVPNSTQMYTQGLSLLDTGKGADQHEHDLLPVIQLAQPQDCWDFDSDYNATKLVTSSCSVSFPSGTTGQGVRQGPASIQVHAITGGSGTTTFTSSNLGIAHVRLLGYTSSSLLLIMENQNFGANVPVDSSQNGLWKVNTDGSGLTLLTDEGAGNWSNFNLFTQYPWSNVSFDGTKYALQIANNSRNVPGNDPITTLYYGSLSGGSKTSFAFAHVNDEMVEVAGWTLM